MLATTRHTVVAVNSIFVNVIRNTCACPTMTSLLWNRTVVFLCSIPLFACCFLDQNVWTDHLPVASLVSRQTTVWQQAKLSTSKLPFNFTFCVSESYIWVCTTVKGICHSGFPRAFPLKTAACCCSNWEDKCEICDKNKTQQLTKRSRRGEWNHRVGDKFKPNYQSPNHLLHFFCTFQDS